MKTAPISWLIIMLAAAPPPAAAGDPAPKELEGVAPPSPILYRSHFAKEIDPGLMLQQPTPASITLAPAPCRPKRPALRVSIKKDQDYSRVANGAPRAEANFGGLFTFPPGLQYVVRWQTCLPPDFKFDPKQPEGIAQIHEGGPKGSPPWGLSLVSNRYVVQVRDGAKVDTRDAGDAAPDRGRWVSWTLRYRPDSTGEHAVTELDKDGVSLITADGIPNAYPDDIRSYFKFGIYKWWWQERPSDVSERTIFFSDVSVDAAP